MQNDVQQFRVVMRCIKLHIKDPPTDCDNPLVWVEAAMHYIHAHIISLIPNEERFLIGVIVKSEYFANGAGGLSFHPIENFHYADLWDLIANLTLSNENFQIDESFVLHITFVSIPEGLGARRARKLTINSVTRRSIVSIVNNDNLCLPRLLVVGETYIKLWANETDEARKEWGVVRDGRRKLQRERAEKLMQDANVCIPPMGAGFSEIEQFQNYYLHIGIAIVVYNKKTFGSGEPPFFDGRAVVERQTGCKTEHIINLCYNSNVKHYNAILNLIVFARTKFFCNFCNKCYNFIDQHKCLKTCSKCFVSPSCKRWLL